MLRLFKNRGLESIVTKPNHKSELWMTKIKLLLISTIIELTQLTFTWSKIIIETLEKGVKYFQS